MAMMTKRVNIKAPVAIRNITPPIYGTCTNIIMTTGDILKCLCKRAIVDEILPDGSTVRLTMRNYYTDNGAGLDATIINPPANKSAEENADIQGEEIGKTESEGSIAVTETDSVNDEFMIASNTASDDEMITSGYVEVVETEPTPIPASVIDIQDGGDNDKVVISCDDTADPENISTTDNTAENILTEEAAPAPEVVESNNAEDKVDEKPAAKKQQTKSSTSKSSSTKKKSSNTSSKKKTTSK